MAIIWQKNMPEIIVYSAFQAIVLLDMIPKKRYRY